MTTKVRITPAHVRVVNRVCLYYGLTSKQLLANPEVFEIVRKEMQKL